MLPHFRLLELVAREDDEPFRPEALGGHIDKSAAEGAGRAGHHDMPAVEVAKLRPEMPIQP